MEQEIKYLIDTLEERHSLTIEEYQVLMEGYSKEAAEYAAEKAVAVRQRIYGNTIYIRGLIEISNFCKNGCFYCGINRENKTCERYRLTAEEILECCREGYKLGFRTFVLQGGEDSYFTDKVLCKLISWIKKTYPDCAVTLSLGERSYESYRKLYEAGADRYLLRHETADREHYDRLHPAELSYEYRMQCLKNLKEIGFQTGCGFMVGSPYQTAGHLAKDLKFIEEFKPHMCGIGPFISHKATRFSEAESGSVELTCYLLSLIRLIRPEILLPATTALGSMDKNGREKGILAGANVVMPNLSPASVREKYELYNNKISTGLESAQSAEALKRRVKEIGYEIAVSRGDSKIISERETYGSI